MDLPVKRKMLMNDFRGKKKRFLAIIYMILTFFMLYLNQDGFFLGGFGIVYAYLIGLLLIGLAILSFLVRPQLDRGIFMIQQVYILCLPYLLTVLYSFFVWAIKFSGFTSITRGFFYVFYQLIAFAAAGASFYLLGKNAIWYFWAMLMGVNLFRTVMVVVYDGIGNLWSDFVTLLTSFGSQTGDTIAKLELHDGNFAVFCFLIFIFAYFNKISHKWIVMSINLILALLGFKRIAVVGVLLAWVILLLAKLIKKEYTKTFLYGCAVLLCVLAVVYLVIVRTRLLETLLSEANIDSLGRTDLYQYIEQFYDFGPTYIGNGLGYVSRLLANLSDSVLAAWSESGFIAGELHNDFLRILIDIGVPGFAIWLCSFVFVRLRLMLKNTPKTGIMLIAGIAYLFITYMTDNTYYYYQTNFVFALIVLDTSVDDFEKKTQKVSAADHSIGNLEITTGIGL